MDWIGLRRRDDDRTGAHQNPGKNGQTPDTRLSTLTREQPLLLRTVVGRIPARNASRPV
jgi:hypothetical protein